MEERTKKLIASLHSGILNENQFLKTYFNKTTLSDQFVIELLKRGVSKKDSDLIEEAIVLLSTNAFSIPTFVSKLSNLLLEKWHNKHEDIVTLLKEYHDSNTVDFLYKTALLKLEYLEYDDTYQLARKCIKSLSGINNQESIERLKLLSDYKNTIIANYAKKELIQKGLL
ncbi:MAG: hypothetical protein CL840_07465 [Crocinitomicaceae bacterium]|nr:hypothetical protein [Crocinitomicaceae bacterium]|tara:strand:- start:5256 stop:5765 length:510 start_codon:yes stop_codon:yes gene_type:complete